MFYMKLLQMVLGAQIPNVCVVFEVDACCEFQTSALKLCECVCISGW